MDSIAISLETTSDCAKKRKRQPEKWKANVRKKLIYSAKGGPGPIKCMHRNHWECGLLTDDEIRAFHDAFYALPIKDKQDAFILKYVSVMPTARTRIKDKVSNRGSTLKYHIAGHSVCRDAFLSVLQLTKHRVLGVFQRFKNGQAMVPVETRGGSRKEKLFAQKLEAVIAFIKQFKGMESHYAKNKKRIICLPSDLNIAKLHKMYLNSIGDQDHLRVKETYFRKVFNTKFGATSTDDCIERVKVEQKPGILNDLKTKKTLHETQASCGFEKVSDHTRQLYCYNLPVVSGESTLQRSKENVIVSGEIPYNLDSKVCSKKDKSSSQMDLGVPVNTLKARDMNNLLQRLYGDNWESIPFLFLL